MSFLTVAAASARLCVETITSISPPIPYIAAASARLCVETFILRAQKMAKLCSRLRAAVC